MKRSWLTYLLILSLSLNVGGIAAFLYSWVQNGQPPNTFQEGQPPGLRELVTLLNLDPEQREMFQRVFSAHRLNMQVWHQEMTLKRQELLGLLKEDRTSWPGVQEKLKELSDIQAKKEGAALNFFFQLRQHLKPEQRATCNNFMECRLLKGRGEKGEWCKAQGIYRHRGRGRWRAPTAPSHIPAETGEAQ